MKTRAHLRLAVIAVAAVLLLAAPLWGAYLGRRLSWFEVERVEIAGAHLVAPHEILRVSGIRQGQNVLDAANVWEDALRRHPVLQEARVTRKLPNTLRVRVQEKNPVAFVADSALALATASGEFLPVDPSDVAIDLPIIHGFAGDPRDAPQVGRLLAETGRLLAIDPALISQVSEIRPIAGDSTALILTHSTADIVLPFGASVKRLDQLRAVLTDLRGRTLGSGIAAPGRARVDLRFEDQVVVRHPLPREIF